MFSDNKNLKNTLKNKKESHDNDYSEFWASIYAKAFGKNGLFYDMGINDDIILENNDSFIEDKLNSPFWSWTSKKI